MVSFILYRGFSLCHLPVPKLGLYKIKIGCRNLLSHPTFRPSHCLLHG